MFVQYVAPKKAHQPSRWDETASRDRNPHLKMRAILICSSGTKCKGPRILVFHPERVSPRILVFHPVLTRRLPRSPDRLHRCAHSRGAVRGPRGRSGRCPAARSPTEPHDRLPRCRRDRTASYQIGRFSWFREIQWAKVSPDLSIPAQPRHQVKPTSTGFQGPFHSPPPPRMPRAHPAAQLADDAGTALASSPGEKAWMRAGFFFHHRLQVCGQSDCAPQPRSGDRK